MGRGVSQGRFHVQELALSGLKLITPRVHGDERGFLLERWRADELNHVLGGARLVQENHSRSTRGVLRGLHFQNPPAAQGKLVGVTRGRVYDVAVDVRRSSPTFGRWLGVVLDDETLQQLWLPAGFAHGFLVLSEQADVVYQLDAYHDSAAEAGIRFDDETLGIDWLDRLSEVGLYEPVISRRDAELPPFAAADIRI